MSGENERQRGRQSLILIVVVIGFMVLASAGAFVWWQRSSGRMPSVADQPGALQDGRPMLRPDEPLSITLFIPVNGMLEPVVFGAARRPEVQIEAREAVVALLADGRGGRNAVLNAVRLRAFYLDRSGTAFVDLSPAEQGGIRASAWGELLAIYAIVNTLAQNFTEIRQVRFLVDGRESQTLAGHIDLTRSFVRRADLSRNL